MRLERVPKTPVALPQHSGVEGTSLDHVLCERRFRPYLDVGGHFLSSASGRVWSARRLLLDKQHVRLGVTRRAALSCPAVASGFFSGCVAGEVLQAVSLGLFPLYRLEPGTLSTGEGRDAGGGTGAAAPSAELGLSLWGAGGSRAENPSWLQWQPLSLGQSRAGRPQERGFPRAGGCQCPPRRGGGMPVCCWMLSLQKGATLDQIHLPSWGIWE